MYTHIKSDSEGWTVTELPGGELTHFATEREAMRFAFDRSQFAEPANEMWRSSLETPLAVAQRQWT